MDALLSRLYRHCEPVPEAGCWLWTASALPSGYGRITVRTGVGDYAHRVSWRLHRGEIPAGMFVCHRCDTPSCVNPDHLFLGSHAENMADMSRKGRKAVGASTKSAKLTDEQAAEIFSTRATGAEMAQRHGVSRSAISRIRVGKGWQAAVANVERPERYSPASPAEKTCTSCGHCKPISCFQARPTRPNGQGVYSICKDCKREAARRRYQSRRNPA